MSKTLPFVAGKPATPTVLPDTPTSPTLNTSFVNPGGVPETIGYSPTVTSPQIMPIVPVKGNAGAIIAAQISSTTGPVRTPSALINVTFEVVDENGAPISNAIAFVGGAKTGQASDSSGRIRLTQIEAMTNVVISHLGYTSAYYVAAAIPSRVVLKSGAALDIETITVTGGPKPAPEKKKPFPWWLLVLGAGGLYLATRKKKPVRTEI